MAQQLLTAFGGGIAAPVGQPLRAPLARRAPSTCARSSARRVRVILDGGECQIGLESTIVSFEGEQVRLLRPGQRHGRQLRDVVGELRHRRRRVESPRVPGGTPTHYAPTTPLTIVPAGEIDAQADAASAGGRARRGAGAAPAAAVAPDRHLDQRRPPARAATRMTCTPTCARSTRAGCQRILVQSSAGRGALGGGARPPAARRHQRRRER